MKDETKMYKQIGLVLGVLVLLLTMFGVGTWSSLDQRYTELNALNEKYNALTINITNKDNQIQSLETTVKALRDNNDDDLVFENINFKYEEVNKDIQLARIEAVTCAWNEDYANTLVYLPNYTYTFSKVDPYYGYARDNIAKAIALIKEANKTFYEDVYQKEKLNGVWFNNEVYEETKQQLDLYAQMYNNYDKKILYFQKSLYEVNFGTQEQSEVYLNLSNDCIAKHNEIIAKLNIVNEKIDSRWGRDDYPNTE